MIVVNPSYIEPAPNRLNRNVEKTDNSDIHQSDFQTYYISIRQSSSNLSDFHQTLRLSDFHQTLRLSDFHQTLNYSYLHLDLTFRLSYDFQISSEFQNLQINLNLFLVETSPHSAGNQTGPTGLWPHAYTCVNVCRFNTGAGQLYWNKKDILGFGAMPLVLKITLIGYHHHDFLGIAPMRRKQLFSLYLFTRCS